MLLLVSLSLQEIMTSPILDLSTSPLSAPSERTEQPLIAMDTAATDLIAELTEAIEGHPEHELTLTPPTKTKSPEEEICDYQATTSTTEVSAGPYYQDFDNIDPFTDPFGSTSNLPEYPVPLTIQRWREQQEASKKPKFIQLTNDTCWRCGDSGHQRQSCRRPPILFCSRCGQVGVMSKRCQCGPSYERPEGSRGRINKPLKTRTTSRSVQCCRHRDSENTPCPNCGCPFAISRKTRSLCQADRHKTE